MGERLRLLFCDHLNLARGKYLPASKIGDGSSRFCQGVFAVGYDKDLLAAPGSKMRDGLPDMDAVYKAADIRPGWEPDTKVVVADLADSGGAPLPLCGRSLLKRTMREWEALGYAPKIGLELEAYAFQRDGAAKLIPYETPCAYVYATGRLADPIRFTDAIWDRAAAAGLKLDSITTEYDSPQFEFTLAHDEAVKAVDQAFLFRSAGARDRAGAWDHPHLHAQADPGQERQRAACEFQLSGQERVQRFGRWPDAGDDDPADAGLRRGAPASSSRHGWIAGADGQFL